MKATTQKKESKKQVQKELADLLSAHNDEKTLTVTQKFSQKQGSQRASQQLLDKHYASYGGTNSQIAPPANVAANSQISVVDGTQTQEILPEPLLQDNPNRFVILPI